MKHASHNLKKLTPLLKKIELSPGSASYKKFQALPDASDPIAVLVQSMLLWESTTDKMLAAYARLRDEVVDFNELRICMPHETIDAMGPRYPRVQERCQRLRAVLRNIYLREHATNLNSLAGASKRDVKKYIDSLEGIVPYAASRLMLLSFEIPCIPVDEQLRNKLFKAEVTEAEADLADISNWLSEHVKPEHAAHTHAALQAWVDASADRPAGEKKPAAKRSAPRRTTKAKA